MSPYRKYSRLDPRYHWGRAHHDLGRRGTVLLTLGVLWVCTGLSVIGAPGSRDYPLLTDVGPWENVRGAAWIVTGAVAIVCSRRRQGDDWPGWLALYAMVAYRIVAYAHGWVLWALPGVEGGTPRGIVGVLAWAVALVPIAVCSGWEEPPARPTPEEAP